MEQTHETHWEQAVARLAQRFEYPPTPEIRPPTADRRPRVANGGRPSAAGRRLAWAALIFALLVAGALAVPQTRAALLSFFVRVGAIDIFIDETIPTATPTAPPAPRPTVDESAAIIVPPTPVVLTTPSPASVAHSLALYQLGDPVTLAEAQDRVDYDLAVPAALGEPDEVYVHRGIDLPAATLVWRMGSDDEGGDAPLSLTIIGIEQFAAKMVGEGEVHPVRVNGEEGVWIAGPHRLQLLGNWEVNDLTIESNVLIWTAGGLTYRLEGDLSEAEMIAIAESLAE